MKVLYISDFREGYLEGSYYEQWNEAALAESVDCCTIFDIPDNLNYNIIILSHSFIANILNRRRYTLFRKFKSITLLNFFLHNDDILLRLKRSSAKKILLSRNDYKGIGEKAFISNFLNVDLLITHTKAAIKAFKKFGVNARIFWMPFSVTKNVTKNRRFKKKYHIGMRGSVADVKKFPERAERVKFFQALVGIDGFEMDLHVCRDASCFLSGDEYFDWISSCELIAFNASAMGTLGPKYFEAIACGANVIAIENEFDGLLKPYKHYLPVAHDFHNLKSQLNLYFSSPELSEEMAYNSNSLFQKNSIEEQLKYIINFTPC